MAVRQILLINLIIFTITYILEIYSIDLNNTLALYPIGSDFYPYQLITHLFSHANFDHIFSNMLIFILLAPSVENNLGYKEFWKFYLLSGLFSSGLYFLGSTAPMIGASGAVFSVMAASIILLFKNGEYKKIKNILIIFFFVLVIINEVINAFYSNDNVGHFAHLFGVVFGTIYILQKNNFNFYIK